MLRVLHSWQTKVVILACAICSICIPPQLGRVHVSAAVAAGRAGRARAAADVRGAALGAGGGAHQPAPGTLDHQLPAHALGAVLPAEHAQRLRAALR